MTTVCLTDTKFELASLDAQIQPWVQTMIESAENQIWAVLWAKILDFTSELHA